MNCPECQAQIIQQDKYCPKCGHKIDWEEVYAIRDENEKTEYKKNTVLRRFIDNIKLNPEIEALICIVGIIVGVMIIWSVISGLFFSAPHGKYYSYTKTDNEYIYNDDYLDFGSGGSVKWYDRYGDYEIAQYEVKKNIVTIEGEFLYSNFYGGKLKLEWDRLNNELRYDNTDGFKKRM